MKLSFEWDEAKAKANLKKHRVGFDEAATVFTDSSSITIHDHDRSADEQRFINIGSSEKDRVLVLAPIIHEDFYCNRRYAAVTSLTAGELAARSVNILFQVCLPPSRLRAPVSPGVSAVSSRTLVNNAG